MTLEVIVVRHAIAFERDRRRWPDDALRPLTPAGKRRFRKAALGLRKWSPRVDAVLSSPFVRTRQTAELLTKFAGWPAAIECSALVPGTPPALMPVSYRVADLGVICAAAQAKKGLPFQAMRRLRRPRLPSRARFQPDVRRADLKRRKRPAIRT